MLRTSALALVLGVFALPAYAATPESGTITESSPQLSYTFPLAPLANASGLVGLVPGQSQNYSCDATFPCDEFALTLDLPADYLETFPDAVVWVSAATSDVNFDIDLQIANEAGEVLYIQRDNPPEQPTIIFSPAGGVEKFVVQVTHGTPHTGGSTTITLQPGDAAKSVNLFAGGLGLGLLLPLALLAVCRRLN